MSKLAAARADLIVATDQHRVQGVLVAVPFKGLLCNHLATSVLIEKAPAARVHSEAMNYPPHVPPSGTSFDHPPTNKGVVWAARCRNVMVENWPIAIDGDRATTCNDTGDINGVVSVSDGTVLVGEE